MHGRPSVSFRLTEASGAAMAELTGAMIGERLTFSLCGRGLVQAVVRESLSGRDILNLPSPEAAVAVAKVLTGDAPFDALEPRFDEYHHDPARRGPRSRRDLDHA
jgi:preprotein translocase subunit SecD